LDFEHVGATRILLAAREPSNDFHLLGLPELLLRSAAVP